MGLSRLVSDEELCAYVDGDLSEDRRRQVAEVLADDRELADKAARFRRQNELLRSIGADTLHEPVPDALLDVLRRAKVADGKLPASALRERGVRRVLSHVVCGLIGLAVGFFAGRWGGWI